VLYAVLHPNFVPTSGSANALFMCLMLPLSGTHYLAAFVSVNLIRTPGPMWTQAYILRDILRAGFYFFCKNFR